MHATRAIALGHNIGKPFLQRRVDWGTVFLGGSRFYGRHVGSALLDVARASMFGCGCIDQLIEVLMQSDRVGGDSCKFCHTEFELSHPDNGPRRDRR